MLTRRALLAATATGAMTIEARALSLPVAAQQPLVSSLSQIAAHGGRLYGCAVASGELKDDAFASVLAREAGILVAEYEMKRSVTEPRPGQHDFAAADTLLRFALERKMAFRGHTLLWHKSNPPWLAEALSSSRRDLHFTGYIQNAVARYRGQMHSWDVVNEALTPDGNRSDHLRETLWLKAFGTSYIDLAFHAARAADPKALLVYNDWGCEAGGPNNDRFRAITLNFLEEAKARGVPIDAYGMQGHLQAFGTPVDQRKLGNFVDRLAALNLHLLVTEHDVDDSGGPVDIGLRDRAVADASRRFLDVVLDSRATIAVLTWGLSDRFVDPPGWKAHLAGYSPRALPLDGNFARKPMWSAMAHSFASARPQLTNG